jgi:hypothetical protein
VRAADSLPARRGDAASSALESFGRGSRAFHEKAIGYADDGTYLFNTAITGNSSAGHDYGTKLSTAEKRDLIEYFKTL